MANSVRQSREAERSVQRSFNSLTTKTADYKIFVCKVSEMLRPSYIILRIQRLEGKQCSLDEVAHSEPPHQDLRCLQIQLFSSVVLKELSNRRIVSDPRGICILRQRFRHVSANVA